MSAWPDERRREYVALAELVRLVRGLDNGGGWMAKIERCVAIADGLSRDDLSRPQVGFMTWLHGRVTGTPVFGDPKEPAPVLWCLTYMGKVTPHHVHRTQEAAQAELDRLNTTYPDGAALRRLMPLYAGPVTQKEAP